jgi:hypothetical protein
MKNNLYKVPYAPFLVKKSIDFLPYMNEKVAIPYESEARSVCLAKIEGETLV